MSYIVPEKMPMRCFECKEISSSTIDGYSCSIAHKSLASEHGINVRRPDWCPLIEIPTPHGRLGDLDELINGCEKLMHMLDPEGKEYLRVFAIKSYLMWAAEYAVIEAEGET